MCSSSNSSSKKFIKDYIFPFKFTFVIAILFVIFTTFVFLGIGIVVKFFANSVSESISYDEFKFKSLYMLFVFIFALSLGIFFRSYFMSKGAEKIVLKMRKDFYQTIVNLPVRFFYEKNRVNLVSFLSKDIPFIGNTITYDFSGILRQILTIVGAIIMLVYNNLQLTLALFSITPFILVFSIYIGKKMKSSVKNVDKFVGRLNILFEESVYGIKVIKSFNRELLFIDRFLSESLSIYQRMSKYILLKAFFVVLIVISVFMAMIVILMIGVKGLFENNLSAGELSAFIVYAIIVAGAVSDLSDRFGKIQQFKLAINKMYSEVLDYDYSSNLYSETKSIHHDFKKEDFETLEFKNVSFRYGIPIESYTSNKVDINKHNIYSSFDKKSEKNVLENISFSINKGEKVALVGISGAGKTTIFDLIMGFNIPISGEILINGKINYLDLSPTQIHSLFSWTPQELTIFSGDVGDNVSFFDKKYKQSDIINALELAYAKDFVLSIGGISSDLGEKGAKISHGQKQRIAIARAILYDAPILLMDEVTSALDVESENYIKKYLNSCDKTQIVIAHRLSTVIASDKIWLLQDGSIIAEGTHNELLNTNSEYRKMVSMLNIKDASTDFDDKTIN